MVVMLCHFVLGIVASSVRGASEACVWLIAREGAYSIEFAVGARRRRSSIGFWEDKQFVCKPILHC